MGKHVVIVGSGIIGLTTAYYCSQRGMRVTLIERNPEQREGCSFGNAGMVVPSHFIPLAAPGMVALGLKWMWNRESPFYIKPRLDCDLFSWALKFWQASTAERVALAAPLIRDLSFASRGCFEELARLPGDNFGLVKNGLLMLCKTQHALDEESKSAACANRLGVPAEVLDSKQTAALDRNVHMDIAGSVYFPMDCHLSPNQLMARLLGDLKCQGVQFHWETELSGWKRRGEQITGVVTNRGEMDGEEFVLCAGVWSSSLVRQLGLNLPMQAGKGYSLTLSNPRELPKICSILSEARVAVTPMGSQLRVGGTMEIAGLDERINPIRVRGIVRALPKYFPAFRVEDFEGISPWHGLRPCSPDGLPYLGRTRQFNNVTIATGHAMMGLSLGPITGKLVSEILADSRPSIPIHLLDPDRYH